ncbi:MAG: type II toxin-antitoxin system RelE/ParE family toxin [Pseudomonadota bacterium]|nr:type II toxin-antitoxin system RelE/ParE family toxin [Pseudomonadota bacterium]
MSRLIWSPSALRDVQRLHRFLVGKNADAVKRAVQAFWQGVKVLGHQPQIGRTIEDTAEAYCKWQIDFGDSGHVVRYLVATDTVAILAVRHQKEVGN